MDQYPHEYGLRLVQKVQRPQCHPALVIAKQKDPISIKVAALGGWRKDKVEDG